VTLKNGVDLPALGLGVFQSRRRRRGPPSRRRSLTATSTWTQPRRTATSSKRARLSGTQASSDRRSSPRPRSGSATTDTARPCMASGRARASPASIRSDLLILRQALPSEFGQALEAYRALETLPADGKVRAIAVSNLMAGHLSRLLDRATVVPAVNQVEAHPYFAQPVQTSMPGTASPPRPGHRSAGSPATATAATPAPSPTRSSKTSPLPTPRPPPS
jgi:hypothetical protein